MSQRIRVGAGHGGALLLVLLVSCLGRDPVTRGVRPGPIVREQQFGVRGPHLKMVAIAPFSADPGGMPALGREGSGDPAAAADRVALFFSQALTAEGVDVVPSTDMVLALRAAELEVPGADTAAIAEVAARKFSATGVILGTVSRYREREGGALAISSPASVTFEVRLHAAPSGRRLWTGRFSHTQQSMDNRPLEKARYPGRGTRWLSADELARWGAQNAARSLAANP